VLTRAAAIQGSNATLARMTSSTDARGDPPRKNTPKACFVQLRFTQFTMVGGRNSSYIHRS